MTLYTAGIAKGCCEDFLSSYYDPQIEQRRSVHNNLYSEFKAEIFFNYSNFNPCSLANSVGEWRPCDPDPTDEFDPPQHCQDYYEISGYDKEFWQAQCNMTEAVRAVLEDGEKKTFRYSLIYNFGLQPYYGFVWISAPIEINNPEIRKKPDTRDFWLYECSYQIRLVVTASDLNPDENLSASFTYIECSKSRYDFCGDNNVICCPGPGIYGSITRGPIEWIGKVYPNKILAKAETTPKYFHNQETLYDCAGKTIEMIWNDQNALYVSDWQTCGNQPFRLIGYQSISNNVSRYTLNAANCHMEFNKVGPYLPLIVTQYPSYPYSGGYGNNHGAYNTAGYFDCGLSDCWKIQDGIDE